MRDLLGWTAKIGLQVYSLDQLLKSAGRERYSSLRAIEITPLLANGILKIFLSREYSRLRVQRISAGARRCVS